MDRKEVFQKIVSQLVDSDPKSSKELAKELDDPLVRKSDVNSLIYAAEKLGLVEKIEGDTDANGKTPAPKWRLTFETLTLGKVPLEDS